MVKTHTQHKGRIAAQNRRARHDYTINEVYEAGIVLTGTEVKSIRDGRASIKEAYAGEKNGAIWLMNAHIPEYGHATKQANHDPDQPRKLLLHGREVSKLLGAIKRQGQTLVPLSIYFTPRGLAKVELALATGKHNYDKRAAIRDRDWKRQKERLLRPR